MKPIELNGPDVFFAASLLFARYVAVEALRLFWVLCLQAIYFIFKLKIFAGRPVVLCSVVNVFNLRPIDALISR